MNSLFGSKLYRAFKEGYSVQEIAFAAQLGLDEVEQRIAAAALCFEHQVECDYTKIGPGRIPLPMTFTHSKQPA